MTKKFLLAFAVLGLALASAKSFTVNLYAPASVGGTKLEAGAYTVEVKDAKAVIKNGKIHGEFPVQVETAPAKFSSTTVKFDNEGGKMEILEIRLGGTSTKLVFNR